MLLAFNLMMLGVDAVALFAVARARSVAGQWAVLGAAGFAMLLLMALTGESAFGQMRLLACGLFIHGVIVTLGIAATKFRAHRKLALAWLVLATLLAAVGADAFWIEPYWLETTHVTLNSSKLDHPLRVVVIADLQTDAIGEFERDVLEKTMDERPDLILFAGDYIQVDDPQEYARLGEKLRQLIADIGLTAPLGLYAVKGNIDPEGWEALFAGTIVQTISTTRAFDLEELRITGLSQRDSLRPNLEVEPSERFHIAVGHHPDYSLSDAVHADLLLAGHTHGGQVRVPLVGPLLTLSRVPRSWAAGVTERGSGRTLIVSRGAGMERGSAPRLRFLCRPELVVIALEPAAKSRDYKPNS